jgi:hypothetical protein
VFILKLGRSRICVNGQIIKEERFIMIEVGKPARDFELVSHLGGNQVYLGAVQGAEKRHVGVLSVGLDTDLKQRDSWTRSPQERVQGL